MSNQPPPLSRRSVVVTGATLLAGFGLGVGFPATARAAGRAAPGGTAAREGLAVYRPITVSSTDYAPTPGEFAVDRVSSRRRAGHRLACRRRRPPVDLRGPAGRLRGRVRPPDLRGHGRTTRASSLHERQPARQHDRPGDPVQLRRRLRRSRPLATTARGPRVHRTDSGPGGVVDITLAEPVVGALGADDRAQALQRQPARPQRLRGLRHGPRATGRRPPAGPTGERTPAPAPELEVAADGTVPLESGWTLTMDDWAGTATAPALSGPAVDTGSWLPGDGARHRAGHAGGAGTPAGPGGRLQQPAHPGGAVAALLVVPARASAAARPAHRVRPAHLAGVRRHQPRGGHLAQRRSRSAT